MNDINTLQTIFSEVAAKENVSLKQKGTKFEYEIKCKKFAVLVEYDSEPNQFSVQLLYPSRDVYELSSYEFYKQYDKKRTKKKMFGKKTFQDHLVTIATFLREYLSVLYEEDTAKVFFNGKMRGYGKLFVE